MGINKSNNLAQGDIIKVSFNPIEGHEQRGHSPAVVVSNDTFNSKTNMTLVCPITNSNKYFPLHVELDKQTNTTGVILCEHVRSLDLTARNHHFVEVLPEEILEKVLKIIKNQF